MSRRIMLVDDDRDILGLTQAILRGAGYSVAIAASGREALSGILASRPDLVLLDVNMPDMDGWELLRLLQADESTGRIPIVMFSVKMEVRDKVHALQEGALDYITKPFSHDELLQRVERIFARLEVAPERD